jgi:hypothetical protein
MKKSNLPVSFIIALLFFSIDMYGQNGDTSSKEAKRHKKEHTGDKSDILVSEESTVVPLKDVLSQIEETDIEFSKKVNSNSFIKSKGYQIGETSGNDINTSGGQKELETQYYTLNNNINSVSSLKKEIENLEKQMSLINNQITLQKIISPTNSWLGTSFSEVVLKNAANILKPALSNNKRSKFEKIMELVVKNPLVSTLASSNPITSMARDIISQAITVSDGEIAPNVLTEFRDALTPQLNFYSEIDNVMNNLDAQMTTISLAVGKKKNKLIRIEQYMEEVLNKYPGTNNSEKLRAALKYNNIATLTANEIRDILISSDVRSLNQLMDRQLNVADDFLDDSKALNLSYNSFKQNMVKILEKARTNNELNFDIEKIKEAVAQYEVQYKTI